MKSLKKIIGGYMYHTTFILVIMIVLFLFLIQIFTEQRRAVDDSRRTLQQIGQVVEENQNELSYIFSLFRVSPDANYYAIDCESGEIVGSSEISTIGRKASDVGFNMKRVETDPDCFHNEINGVLSFCVFEKAGDTYIGRVVSTKTLYRRVPMTVMWITAGLLVLALILANAVIKHMNKYVVKEIHDVNGKLQLISEGNLEEEVDVRNSYEFNELSDYINEMVKSLVESNKRMSYLLEKTNLHIGTYEYGKKMNKVRFSGYIRDIFGMDENKAEELSSDIQLFRKFIDDVRKNPLNKHQMGIFRVGDKFIRIDETEKEGSIFGIAVDVSEQVKKVIEIERERDIDTLTGLYNRRGLTEKLDELFSDKEALGINAVVMIDADGLKQINDTYGHEKGDIYLKKIADIINNFGIKSSIASRQGGDEFVLFLYEYDSREELIKVIETLKYIQGNSNATLSKGLTVPLRFSLGYAIAEENEDYQSLFKIADEEMYKNKTERKKMQRENKG